MQKKIGRRTHKWQQLLFKTGINSETTEEQTTLAITDKCEYLKYLSTCHRDILTGRITAEWRTLTFTLGYYVLPLATIFKRLPFISSHFIDRIS